MKILMLGFLLLAGCGTTTSSSLMLHSFGDSITYGYTGNPRYTTVVAQSLGRVEDNQGQSGLMMYQGRLFEAVGKVSFGKSDIVTLMVGYNDVRNYGADPTYLNEFSANLDQFISDIGKSGCMIVVGTVLNINTVMANDPNNEMGTPAAVQAYNDLIHARVAHFNTTQVRVAEVSAAFDSSNQNLWAADLGHPSTAGHAIIAKAFLDAINQ